MKHKRQQSLETWLKLKQEALIILRFNTTCKQSQIPVTVDVEPRYGNFSFDDGMSGCSAVSDHPDELCVGKYFVQVSERENLISEPLIICRDFCIKTSITELFIKLHI